MIAMIILTAIAVMIFFGVTDRFFSKTGVANWVAFLVVLVFAVAYVFPPLITGGNVSISYAGFFLPVILCAVCLFAVGANFTLLKSLAAILSIAGVVVASRIALPPMRSTAYYAVCVAVSGVCGGVVACVITQNRLATLASVLGGAVLGDFITAMLYRFVTGATANMFMLGQNGIFDTMVTGAFIGALSIEIAAAISRAAQSRRAKSYGGATAPVTVLTEAAQDNDIPEDGHKEDEQDDLYDEYFNDDTDR